MITIHDTNGKYLYYNGPTGYAISPEDIVGKMPHDLFDKKIADELMEAFHKVKNTGESESIEVHLDWLGEKRWFSEYIYPFKNEGGEGVEIVKVCRDINERKVTEQEIEKQTKTLLESERSYRDVVETSSYLISVVDTA
jgi:PAS domain S-box-containing protein